jgi:glycosyltransferase involved in cell wall biosynthesis
MKQVPSGENPSPLAFFDFAASYGGSFRSTAQLACALARHTEVVVIDTYGDCASYIGDLKASGTPMHVLSPGWPGRTTIGGASRLERLRRIASAGPDMVSVAARLRCALHTLKPRALWVNSEKALFTAWLAAPRDLPIAIYVRGELPKIRRYCALAWRRANAAIGISQESLRYLSTTRYAHGNLQVVYNGIDVDRTIEQAKPEPRELPSGNGGLRVVFPASIGSPLKGHEIGIRAISAFIESGGQADLWICGEVPLGAPTGFYKHMQQLTADLGLGSHVHFLGSRHDILSIMARSDIVLLPSFTEGLPRSLLEAMALAKAIIGTRVGGIPELVRDGIDGILVDPGDIRALVGALSVLHAPDIRTRMGKSGQDRARVSFSLEQHASRFLYVMDSLVKHPRRVATSALM